MGQVFGSKKKARVANASDAEKIATGRSSSSSSCAAARAKMLTSSGSGLSAPSSSGTPPIAFAENAGGGDSSQSSILSLTQLKPKIIEAFGEQTANQLLSPKWDYRETALRRISSEVSAANILVTCSILECSCNDKVFSVILAAHECFLRVLRLKEERGICLQLLISGILPKSWVQAPKIAKSAKLLVRHFVEGFPDQTSFVIQELYNQSEDVSSRRATVCLGALEVLDLVLQGDGVAKKFAEAREATIDLLRLGFQDGLGPKIRFRATTVVNRIRDVVQEDELEPLFRDLRPAVVSQINRARKEGAEVVEPLPTSTSGAVAGPGVGGKTISAQKKNKYLIADIDGDELLMDEILDETGMVFQKSDKLNDDSSSVGGSTRESFGIRSADLLT